jgi:antitoxin component YwqK of YwqJK toxin-antitoxin module
MGFAWYRDGSLMLIEEYESDVLIKGSYYKKGDTDTISSIENGQGFATLYDSEGKFLKKISYLKGRPIDER